MVAGSKALKRARSRWLIGNTLAISRSVLDSCELGTNTPEMKYSGSTVAWMTGCAESSELMKLDTAKARQQKLTAPTATPIAQAGTVEPGR